MDPIQQIVLCAVAVVGLIAVGIFLEHYLGPKPKLDTDELFMAMDLIDAEFEGEEDRYNSVRNMRDELHTWMEAKGPCEVSRELYMIIERVRDVVAFEDMPED